MEAFHGTTTDRSLSIIKNGIEIDYVDVIRDTRMINDLGNGFYTF